MSRVPATTVLPANAQQYLQTISNLYNRARMEAELMNNPGLAKVLSPFSTPSLPATHGASATLPECTEFKVRIPARRPDVVYETYDDEGERVSLPPSPPAVQVTPVAHI